MPDGDLLRADEDVLDEQPQDALAVFDGGGGGAAVQLGEEAFQVGGEGEVGVPVGGLGVERVDLAAQAGLAGAQGRHPRAQLVDGDQLLGVGLDHRGDRGGGLGQSQLQLLALPGGRVGGAGLLEPLADLGADQGRVGEQGGDVIPHDLVEVVGADRLVAADPAAFVAVVIAAQAPVVVDLPAGGAGRGAVVGVAAGRAGGQALQQGRDLGVAGGEPLVVLQPLPDPGEGAGVHDGRDRDLQPLLPRPVDGLDRPRCGAALQPGDAVQSRRPAGGHGLAEHRRAGVSGVAEHGPDHAAVPAVLAGPGGCALAGQPAGQVGDRGAVVGVTAEHLRDQDRLMPDDLVGGPGMIGFAEVPVPEWGTGQDVHRTGAGAVCLAAPVALHQLGFLVLGEHALELHHQLILRAVPARALEELHPHPGAGEFLDQQRLVGELAGQPVRGVDEHHIDAALGGQVTQRLQGRADQGRPGMTLVLEHPFFGQVSPELPGVLAQRRGLRPDRLVLLLPGAGDPGVDRRARHGAAFLPGRPGCGPAAVAREWRRPPTVPWPRGGRRRTPSRLPGRSPAGRLSAAPREEFGQRAGHHGGDRGLALARVRAHPRGQPRGQLDGEHHARLGHRHPAARGGLVHVPAGLAHRNREPGSQHRCRLRHGDAGFCQLSGSIDPRSVFCIAHTATSHDTNILPDMSLTGRDTPRPFQPPVAQRDIKAEVIYCVGGVISPYWSDVHLVVDWEHDGERLRAYSGSRVQNTQYFFRPGLTWPLRTASGFAPRILPKGCIFGHKGPAAVGDTPLVLLSWLSCRVADALMAASQPAGDETSSGTASKSYEVGLVQRLPWPGPLLTSSAAEQLARSSEQIARFRRGHDELDETSRLFTAPACPRYGSSIREAALARHDALWDDAVESIAESAAAERVIADAIGLDSDAWDYLDQEIGPHPDSYPAEPLQDTTHLARLFQLSMEELIKEAIAELGGSRTVATMTFVADRRLEILAHMLRRHPSIVCDSVQQLRLLPPGEPQATAHQVLSYLVGVAYGRWDVRAAGSGPGEPSPGLFDPVPLCSPGMLTGSAGQPLAIRPDDYPLHLPPLRLLIDEPGHKWDIAAAIERSAHAVFGEPADMLAELREILRRTAIRDHLRKQFFKDHLSRYSASRRKAPIYWPLTVPSGNWGVWVYAPAFTRETLYAVASEAGRRERLASEAMTRLRSEQRAGAGGRAARRASEELDAEERLAEELRLFRLEAERIAGLGWEPDLDDGIILCAAPLADLFPAWPDTSTARAQLRRGMYPWATVASWADRL